MPKNKKKAIKRKSGFVVLRERLNNNPLEVYTYGGRDYATPNGMPSLVKVLGQHFEVRYHSCIYAAPKSSERLRGIVMYGQRLIVIDPRQSIHSLRETLYHEMAHVYLHYWQTKSPALAKLSPLQVEEVCDMFSEGYYDALLNNS